VKYKLLRVLIAGGMSLLMTASSFGDVHPTNVWVNFYGSASTYNGQPLPVGSVIDAYDAQGTHCGTCTVDSVGRYGFMPVYADDPLSALDEGASEIEESLSFVVNGRLAAVHGPDTSTWSGNLGENKEVNLSATALISISSYSLPTNKFASPGDTVRYTVGVQNTGQGIDFYTISAASNNGWVVRPFFGFVYAPANQVAYLYFDFLVPPILFEDTSDIITFRVSSGIDPSVYVEGTVTTRIVMTDAPDDGRPMLPDGFNLYQNYPNPFNPSTVISFDLPAASEVSIEIYDLLGRRIDNFDLGRLTAGNHNFEYSASAQSSGIYFYRLRAGGLSEVKKMILLK
jgi:hypothetical protein